MLRYRMLAGLLALALPAVPASAQVCSGGNQLFKNDALPAVPAGAFPTAIVQGLCEGEAAGCVFTLAPGQPAQKVNRVAVGFAAAASGSVAAVSVEVYDGVTWSGDLPILGPKVFDSEVATGGLYQVSSTAINEFDLSPYDVVVGGTGNFAVAFQMQINLNGTCASGHPANFFTDAGVGGPTCTPKKNLMYILGAGWRDPSTYKVGGIISICPLYYAGNWVIRACTEDGVTCQQVLGFSGPGNLKLSSCGEPLATGKTSTFSIENAGPSVPVILLVSNQSNPVYVWDVAGILYPLPVLVALTVPTLPNGSIAFPINGGGGPFDVYTQGVAPDAAQPKGYEVSNALRLAFLP